MLSGLKRGLTLLPGWRTPRKLVVLQSDDWYSIRTSSLQALERLRALGVDSDRCHYMKYDHFETSDDLSALFEVLGEITDSVGRPAMLTANCLSANPDFSRIEESGFQEYFSESSIATSASIQGAERNMTLWKQGIADRLCEPQSHGREHLHVNRWMRSLVSDKDEVMREAFRNRMFGVSGHVVSPKRESFLAALDSTGEHSTYDPGTIVGQALAEFEKMFGFVSRSFIAPNYVWGDEVESVLHRHGVQFIQSGRMQWSPTGSRKHRSRKRRFLGQTNDMGQSYLVRNVDFEPASKPDIDWADHALSQTQIAFRLRKPAIISTHRVNFMGGLDESNRLRGLRELRKLLRAIMKKWPSAEFISTSELGELVCGDRGF